jgi:hypothetical protein
MPLTPIGYNTINCSDWPIESGSYIQNITMVFNANGIKYFKATNEKGVSFDKGDSDKKVGDESYSLDFT